jgi:hypothetical protein
MKINNQNPSIPKDMDPDMLVELLDHLCETGSQHINLDIGEQTKVQTVNTTECNPQLGPCAVPNLGEEPEEDDEAL